VLGQLTLRFTIDCEVAVAEPLLALEDIGITTIHLDGQPVAANPIGWWVDPCLSKVALPPLSPGRHELILLRPFHRKSYVERCYVLGDFGVAVAGRFAMIIAPVRKLQWGDWTNQGLPFYAGNVTYHCRRPTAGAFAIRIPHHATPLLKVDDVQAIVPPYRAVVAGGEADVAVTAFGNRYNAFGDFGNYNIYAYYNAGIPTAQANYLGSIGYGGTYQVSNGQTAFYVDPQSVATFISNCPLRSRPLPVSGRVHRSWVELMW